MQPLRLLMYAPSQPGDRNISRPLFSPFYHRCNLLRITASTHVRLRKAQLGRRDSNAFSRSHAMIGIQTHKQIYIIIYNVPAPVLGYGSLISTTNSPAITELRAHYCSPAIEELSRALLFFSVTSDHRFISRNPPPFPRSSEDGMRTDSWKIMVLRFEGCWVYMCRL